MFVPGRHVTTLIGLAWCLSTSSLVAQRIHMHSDETLMWSNMVAHVDGHVVRLGPDWRGDVIFTLQGDDKSSEARLFQGFSTSALDVLFTVREGRLMAGDSHFTQAILYTAHEDQIFQGDSTFPLDVVYTLREENAVMGASRGASVWGLYTEDSRSWSDRVVLFEGKPSTAQLFALLLATGWL